MPSTRRPLLLAIPLALAACSDSGVRLTVPAVGTGIAWLFPIVAGSLGRGAPIVIDPPLGTPCSAGAECATGLCVDGVCCDAACGGGAADCQACSAAAGATADGTCTVLADGAACGGGTCSAAVCVAPPDEPSGCGCATGAPGLDALLLAAFGLSLGARGPRRRRPS